MNPSHRPDLKGRKILVVDDDRLNRKILHGILQPAGFTVIEVESGEAAVEAYEKCLPDLVLLDVVMPGMDGFQICRELKSRYGDSCAPVIFITAKSESSDVVEGLEAGGADYLPKPFRPKEALARIRAHVQNRLLLEQLSQANMAKNRFLGMAAHDLRNPLASIRGLAEFLIEGSVGPLTPDQLDLVSTMHTASQAMLELVNELLDVATIEAGELKMHLAPNSLAEIIAKSVAQMNIEGAKKQTRITFDSNCLIAPLMLDANKMRQVIDNLLSNAIKYSPPHSTVTVFLFVNPTHNTCGFSVQDMGPGIPEGEQDKLFKDFSCLSVQTTGGEKSTGLGLAICRKIVSAHDGSITGTNLPHHGCEFRVTLPFTP